MPPTLRLRPARAVPLLLSAAFLSACDTGPAPGGDDGAVPHLDLGPPDVRVGSLDDPAAALVPVGDLALGPDGTAWAAQDQDRVVLAVGPDGGIRRRVGGPGEGPGEFSAIGRLGWLGDTLWVADSRNRRVTFFGPDGSDRGSTPLPETQVEEGANATFHGLVPGGALFVLGPGATELMGPEGGAPGLDPVVIAPREGGPPRTLGVRAGVRERRILTESAGGDIRGIFIFEQPWSDVSLLALEPGGRSVVVVDRRVDPSATEPRYRVTRIALSGDTLWSTHRGYVPVPVDPAHRDSLLARYAESGPGEESVREGLFLPATLPPASRAFLGRDGRVWVARERPRGTTGGAWDVFSTAGELALTVTAPSGVELGAADAEMVWGVETDAFDVPYLVRFPLPGTPPPEG